MSARQFAASFVAEIDEAELTLRLLEIGIGMNRPEGQSVERALRDAKVNAAMSGPEAVKVYRDFALMARAAIFYFKECIDNGRQPS